MGQALKDQSRANYKLSPGPSIKFEHEPGPFSTFLAWASPNLRPITNSFRSNGKSIEMHYSLKSKQFVRNEIGIMLLHWATAPWISSLFGWTEYSRSWSHFLIWQFFVLPSLIRATYPIEKGHIRLTETLKSLTLCFYSIATKRNPISVQEVEWTSKKPNLEYVGKNMPTIKMLAK